MLVEEGFEYVCDWVLDDQPVRAEDANKADRQRALHAGVQRRRDDADPAPRGARSIATAQSISSIRYTRTHDSRPA